jgi:thiol-disulfide isomerase/thioredoxin
MTSEPSPNPTPALSRRLVLTAAGAAAVSGLGLGWWQYARTGTQAELAVSADPLLQFWRASFDTPLGGKLDMAGFRGKPLLVNFWATWCPPCVDELPLINTFYQENKSKSWQVLGIAADQVKPVNDFMAKMPLSFPVVLAGMAGIELSKSLGNLSGGLPFSVVFGWDGTVRHRQLGRVTPEHLTAWRSLE